MDYLVSADEILEQTNNAILNFASAGISKGDRICISASNSSALVALVLASLKSGVIPALTSSQATTREISEMSSDIAAVRTFHAEHVSEFVEQSTQGKIKKADLDELPQCRPMHFTSGTTGRPKAVWSGWLSPVHSRAWIAEEVDAWKLVKSDVHLVNGPLSHSAPLRFSLMTVLAGGSLIIPPKFDAALAIDHLLNAGVTTTFTAPTHLQRMMEIAPVGKISESLRLLAHAGSFCPDHVRYWAHDYFGIDNVVEFYGSTEGQFTLCPAREWVANRGTVGRARPGRVIESDSEGQLWCQVPDYARFTYWGDEAKTELAWLPGNWFTVGDFGTVNPEGYVYLHGRKGDLVITGGVNVYPAEVERVLSAMPGVVESVAFGLTDAQWGQRLCVAVQGSVTELDVMDFLRVQLSGPKRPKTVFIVDELPRTPFGKVNRKMVPELFDDSTIS